MRDRLLKESDVLKIAFQLPYVVNSAFFEAVKALPSADTIEMLSEKTRELKQERCEYCKDGDFIGQRIMLSNDGKWHKILFCPNCGCRMEGVADEER